MVWPFTPYYGVATTPLIYIGVLKVCTIRCAGILWCWFFIAYDNVVQWCEDFFALWNFWWLLRAVF